MQINKTVIFNILILLFFLVSCKAGKSNEKVLRIGTNAEYPPFEYKEGGDFKGIDIELVLKVAEHLGMKAEIVDMEFDALIPAVLASEIDLAIAAMTITNERRQKVDFSIPYYTANQAIIVSTRSHININSEKELSNYIIGTQNGTTGQLYLDNNFIKTGKIKEENLRRYTTNMAAITELLNDNVEIVIIDDSAANGYAKIKPIKTIFKIETGENYGIALLKNSDLKEKVDNALNEILNSQEWIDLIKKYL